MVGATVAKLQRLDDRLGLSPEPRWERRGGPSRFEAWRLAHPLVAAAGLAASVVLLVLAGPWVGRSAWPVLAAVVAMSTLATFGRRRRLRAWQADRRRHGADGGGGP